MRQGDGMRVWRRKIERAGCGLVCGVCWLTDGFMPRFECRLVGRWASLVNRILILFALTDGSCLSVSWRWKSCTGLDDGSLLDPVLN